MTRARKRGHARHNKVIRMKAKRNRYDLKPLGCKKTAIIR